MSPATQIIAMQKMLLRHDFTEQESKEFLDFVENRNGNLATKENIQELKKQIKTDIELIRQAVTWLKWSLGALLFVTLSGLIWLRKDIQTTHYEIRKHMYKLETDMAENKELLIQIIEKKK